MTFFAAPCLLQNFFLKKSGEIILINWILSRYVWMMDDDIKICIACSIKLILIIFTKRCSEFLSKRISVHDKNLGQLHHA